MQTNVYAMPKCVYKKAGDFSARKFLKEFDLKLWTGAPKVNIEKKC